ncbi:MAG: hypothetical protein HY326_10245 [Chloroflexi bacterium]|nr:hypothetical protein [Chloroflexota bacterium]
MNDLMDDIADQLRHFTLEETIDLVCDFLAELDETEQSRFLNRIAQQPRPLVAEAMGFDDAQDLLDRIEDLRTDIANDVYVEYGAGFDSEYGEYRGFGDDSWIQEMDDLFAAATSFYRAGQFEDVVDAYRELFGIFDLNEEGFHFTRPDPAKALRTNLDEIKQNLFIAIVRSDPEEVPRAVDSSAELATYGDNLFALLDAWQGHAAWMARLETELIERAGQPDAQQTPHYVPSHAAKLLREFYRRYRQTADYEFLCRQIGSQQGWPYADLVERYLQEANWERALASADDGLVRLPEGSGYRPVLQEVRGEALLRLDHPAEAVDVLQSLFPRRRTADVYLKLRQASQASGQWETLYPQLVKEMREQALEIAGRQSYTMGDLRVAPLLGFAFLSEGKILEAVAWGLSPDIPSRWGDEDLAGTVAAGLLRMGLAALGQPAGAVLQQAVNGAPAIIREHGDLLDAVAHSLPATALLDGTVQVYERMVERYIAGRNRDSYAQAAALCQVMRSVRDIQERRVQFEQYYQGLLSSYSRLPALKDELSKALTGSRRQKR